MGVQLFTNNASSTLASGILAGTTSIPLSPGTGSLFPSISGGDYFYVTFDDGAGTREIVKVTARSTDTLTVTRAQEGTSAAAFDAGDVVELRPTAAGLTNFVQKTGSSLTIDDSNLTIQDNADQTKQVRFQASGITTGNTRTVTIPNADTTIPISSYGHTISGPTAARTYTFPNANMSVGYLNIPAVGTKTGSYTLAVGDVGKYVQCGTGAAITIPDATFAEGDVITIANNTSGNITITCTITTAYISGTDSDKATVTLATRGLATIFFLSGTVCVITGNVS